MCFGGKWKMFSLLYPDTGYSESNEEVAPMFHDGLVIPGEAESGTTSLQIRAAFPLF